MKSDLYKNKPTDKVMWLEARDNNVGEWKFTFDEEKFFNLFADYPSKLTPQQKEIFDKENPEWKEFFADRR